MLVLACSQNAQTRGLVEAEFLAGCKPGVLLVNVTRGAHWPLVHDTWLGKAPAQTCSCWPAFRISDAGPHQCRGPSRLQARRPDSARHQRCSLAIADALNRAICTLRLHMQTCSCWPAARRSRHRALTTLLAGCKPGILVMKVTRGAHWLAVAGCPAASAETSSVASCRQ